MLKKMYPPASSSRPEYLMDVPSPNRENPEEGNRVKQGLILALLVVAAATIVLVVPEDDDSYALDAAERESVEDPLDVDDGTRLALATDAALSGAQYSLARSAGIVPAARAAERAKITAEPAEEPTTTTTLAPTTTEAPTTTKAPATTEAPATTAPVTSDDSSTPASDDSSTSSVDESSTSSSIDDSSTSSSVDDSATSSSVVEEETTTTTTATAEETTTTTAAPTANAEGFVDAGHGVLVPAVLLDIRHCESRGDYKAANPSSSARGAYQFLTGSWADYGHKDRYGVSTADQASNAQQDEAALLTWERSGTRPWNASKSCWANR